MRIFAIKLEPGLRTVHDSADREAARKNAVVA